MKIKLDKKLVKKYGFHVGGDMSESFAIAINLATGKPVHFLKQKEKASVAVKVFHVLEIDEVFEVVEAKNPITKHEYEMFKKIFKKTK